MRQSGATTEAAAPLLTLQVGDNSTSMSHSVEWMDPSGRAWQWASMDIAISAALTGVDREATVIMNVTIISSPSDGAIYFDDVSVVPIAFQCKSSIITCLAC